MTLGEYLDHAETMEAWEALEGVSVTVPGSERTGELHLCAGKLYVLNLLDGARGECSRCGDVELSYYVTETANLNDLENRMRDAILPDDFPAVRPRVERKGLHRFGEKGKENFYSLFRIGVEVEGEYKMDRERIIARSGGYFSPDAGTMHGDGSISHRHDGAFPIELVTPIIDNAEQEKKFLSALASLQVGGRFAFDNNSCGTHIHLDLKPGVIAREFPGLELPGIGQSYLLKLLDSVEFEKYFFEEYFRAFRLKKFWDRLGNSYCKTFSVQNRMLLLSPYSRTEAEKAGRGRYAWLNYESLRDGTGIEFRIFPYITSASGMAEIVKFCQYVVLSYWKKKASRERLELIAVFYNGARTIKAGSLLQYDAMLFEAFRPERRNESQVSFDLIEVTDYLWKKYEKKRVRAERAGKI